MNTYQPKEIVVDNNKSLLSITWSDEHKSQIAITKLRGHCPCAECQGHGIAKRFVENNTRGISNVFRIGRYALRFTFADQHSLGIYRFDELRNLDDKVEHGAA